MKFGQTIIAGTILSFTSAVELRADLNISHWGTGDDLYRAYQACVMVDGEALEICDELLSLLD